MSNQLNVVYKYPSGCGSGLCGWDEPDEDCDAAELLPDNDADLINNKKIENCNKILTRRKI